MKKIYWFEPLFFLFFGVFHLHRIWGLIDREAYARFWLNALESEGAVYYSLMIILTGLCLLGIIVFFKELKHNYWWRWIYLCGGAYLLFDLFSIAAGLGFWNELLVNRKSDSEQERSFADESQTLIVTSKMLNSTRHFTLQYLHATYPPSLFQNPPLSA